jgi:hypothetical protein
MDLNQLPPHLRDRYAKQFGLPTNEPTLSAFDQRTADL